MICPHCETEMPDVSEFCGACQRILPREAERSPYAVLGYQDRRLTLDLMDLEERLFRLSKKFHPDRFAGKTAAEIQYSHDHSSAVNNAYRTLKNPILRAKYAVEQELGSIEEKSASVPMDMADLFFEVQDHLDTIRENNGNPPEEALAAVASAESELRQKVRDLEMDLLNLFVEYDEHPESKKLEQMKELLSHRSYIQSFLRQVDSTLGRD
jgi:molecular chaperone HscB